MTDSLGNQLPSLEPLVPADPVAAALDTPLPPAPTDTDPRPPTDIPRVWRQVAGVALYLRTYVWEPEARARARAAEQALERKPQP